MTGTSTEPGPARRGARRAQCALPELPVCSMAGPKRRNTPNDKHTVDPTLPAHA